MGTKTDSEASLEQLDQLTQLIRLALSIRILDLGVNDLRDLPASFIHAIVFHPSLEVLDLTWNDYLGCPREPSIHCPINRLLSELYLAGSSSPFALLNLSLNSLGMTAECCSPALERVLSLGSRGLKRLSLQDNPFLSSHAETFIRTMWHGNFYIQTFFMPGPSSLEWEDGEEGLSGNCWDTWRSALSRNARLEKETHEAALELLKVSQVVFHGFAASSSSSSELAEPPPRFRLLDLPSELLHIVLSSVYLGALSSRQIGSVLRHATDRATLALPPTIAGLDTPLDQPALQRRTHTQSGLDLETRRRLPCTKKEQFLKETECDRYD